MCGRPHPRGRLHVVAYAHEALRDEAREWRADCPVLHHEGGRGAARSRGGEGRTLLLARRRLRVVLLRRPSASGRERVLARTLGQVGSP